MGQVGAVYMNFGMWAISLVPAYLVIKEIGGKYSKQKREISTASKIGGITFDDKQSGLHDPKVMSTL